MAAILVGGVYFFLNYEVKSTLVGGKTVWSIAPKNVDAEALLKQPATPIRPTIRIASMNLGRLDDTKLANHRVNDILMRLFPRFDLIALQGIRSKNQGVLIRLAEQLSNVSGRKYDFATCPTQQRDGLERYNAFVFDATRIDVDRSTVRFVDDRSGQLRIKPLIGAFRVRGPAEAEAFTFTLINVDTDPDRVAVELELLAQAYRAVRDDGRGEDDIILLGDLETDDQHLGPLNKLLGVMPLITGVPTTTRGGLLLDNILLDRLATREFTGRVEVVDMMREFDLTPAGALEVSEHLPIWAEFSAYENGQPGNPAITF